MTSNTSSYKNLTEIERRNTATLLLQKSVVGSILRGSITEAATQWNVHRNTITVIWNRAKNSQLEGSLDVKSKRYGNTNKKQISPNFDYIKTLKFSERSSIERLLKKVKVSVGTVHSWVVNGLLKPHSSPLHPQLTELNKVNRLKFCLNSIAVYQTADQEDEPSPRLKFQDMSITVHIDEKWFYLSRSNRRYYVVDEEDLPYRSFKSKRYITKVMFMCAVSKPVYGDDAQRSSKKRAAGTLETKAKDSVTKQVTKQCLLEKIIPVIKSKWPSTKDKHIFIQQDNATPHITNNDQEFRNAATSDGFNIKLVSQPPNSPDLNTNDLGLFRTIQSLQSENPASNVSQLVAAANGHNNFAIPHMKKDQLQAQGRLPTNLVVDEGLVKGGINMLSENGETTGLENIMIDLDYNLKN
ncbi:hypothetical protein RND81_08G057400 [Saponaria officinalis]|uniref:DUF7769 domain-containing protein n=1 Tax=Saponaria officinalis TaxID=3572 RepID=A0AAW1J314_SAPOF